MKKILFLASSIATSGGIQRSISLISKGLKDNGYDVSIISLFDYDETYYNFDKEIRIYKGSLKRNKDLKKILLRAYMECNSLISNIDFDILIVEGLGLVPFVKRKYFKNNEKVIIVRDHTGFYNYRKFGLSRWGLLRAKKFADYLIVLTKKNIEEYREYFSQSKSRVLSIPNPLDPKIRQRHYNNLSKKICFVGRLSKEKGVDMLLLAMKNIYRDKQFSEWKLDIFGEGPEKHQLKKMIEEYKISDKVTLKGYTSKIYDLYNNYSFLVVPSRFESFGLTIIEALKAGIPVVSFDCPYGPRRIIKHGKNGLLIEANNVEELENGMKRMMSLESLRVKLASNANKYLSQYDYNNVIEQWIKLFCEGVE